MKVVIDGRFVLDEADLYRRLTGAIGGGPGDLIERLAAGDPRPVRLTWINASAIRMALGSAAYEELIAALTRIERADAGKPWPERFVFLLLD